MKINTFFFKQKKAFIAFLIIFLNCSVVYCQHKSLSREKPIYNTAKQKLPEMLSLVPLGKEKYYGFKNREEFKSATLGSPILVYTFSENFFNEGELNVNESLVSTGEWRVPVVVNGEFRAFLTVANYEGKWKVVDFGAAVLAKELGGFEKGNPDDNKVLLRCYQKKCDFLVLGDDSKSVFEGNIYPLYSAKKSLNIGKKSESINMSKKSESIKGFYTLKEIRGLIKD